jgi:hypothetical protein
MGGGEDIVLGMVEEEEEQEIMSSTRRDAFQAEIKRWTATRPRAHLALAATVTIRGHSPEFLHLNFRRWSLHSFTMSVLVHLVYIHGFQGKPASLSERSRVGLQTISLSRERYQLPSVYAVESL